MTPSQLLQRYLGECPLIAIVRGVKPDEAEAIGDAVFEAGIRIIEQLGKLGYRIRSAAPVTPPANPG